MGMGLRSQAAYTGWRRSTGTECGARSGRSRREENAPIQEENSRGREKENPHVGEKDNPRVRERGLILGGAETLPEEPQQSTGELPELPVPAQLRELEL